MEEVCVQGNTTLNKINGKFMDFYDFLDEPPEEPVVKKPETKTCLIQ